MPKITHIFKTYFPDTQGGLEEAIRQIGKSSLKAGFKVQVVSVSNIPKLINIVGIQCQSFKENFNLLSNPFSFDLYKNKTTSNIINKIKKKVGFS